MPRTFPTYSVFVGHIHPEAEKHEIRDLFRGCGEVIEVVILEGKDSHNYNFGFVRFKEKESVICAISELNHWSLHGVNIIVAIEKHTQIKLDQEKAGVSGTVVDVSKKRNVPNRAVGKTVGTDFITDTMYHTRLQESCTAINLQQDNSKHLSVNNLMGDIHKVHGGKTTLWGSIDDVTTDFDEVSRKIMQKCQEKARDDRALGKKNSAEFMCAIRSIMKEITVFLDNQPDKDVKHIDNETMEELEQLELEGTLVRELNNELDNHIESGRDEINSEIHDKESGTNIRKSIPKRLSDVSVQTDQHTGIKEANGMRNIDGTERSNIEGDVNVTCGDQYENGRVTDLTNEVAAQGWNYVASTGENEGEFIDPAIVDYHLSKLKEMEETKNKTDWKSVDKQGRVQDDHMLRLFGSNMAACESRGVGEMSRSSSRDSSLSDGSNEGNVDDSGVESDFFGISKGRRSFGVIENMIRVNNGYRDETGTRQINGVRCTQSKMKEATSEPSLERKEADQFIVRGVGRGRGVFSALLSNQGNVRPSNRSVSQSHL